MANKRQKDAARQNIAKARDAQSARAHGEDVPAKSQGMSTAEKDRVDDEEFAFPKERKEPLTDAERDRAWKRILAAAKKHDIEVSEGSWRDLAKGGKDRR